MYNIRISLYLVYVSNKSSVDIDEYLKICWELKYTFSDDLLHIVQSFRTAFNTLNTSNRLFYIYRAKGLGITYRSNYFINFLKLNGRNVIVSAFIKIATSVHSQCHTIHTAFKHSLMITEK